MHLNVFHIFAGVVRLLFVLHVGKWKGIDCRGGEPASFLFVLVFLMAFNPNF